RPGRRRRLAVRRQHGREEQGAPRRDDEPVHGEGEEAAARRQGHPRAACAAGRSLLSMSRATRRRPSDSRRRMTRYLPSSSLGAPPFFGFAFQRYVPRSNAQSSVTTISEDASWKSSASNSEKNPLKNSEIAGRPTTGGWSGYMTTPSSV